MKKLSLVFLSFVVISTTSCSAIDDYKAKKAEKNAEEAMVELVTNANEVVDM